MPRFEFYDLTPEAKQRLTVLRHEMAGNLLLLAAAKLVALAAKNNFNPGQPRVPAGNPTGGQWTDGGGGYRTPGRFIQAIKPTRGRLSGSDVTDFRPSAGTNISRVHLIRIAANGTFEYKPQAQLLTLLPTKDPLDPHRLNKPVSPLEMQQIAQTLTRVSKGITIGLSPHPYNNYPDKHTGAVLPTNMGTYTAYDVGIRRGRGRLIVNNVTRDAYYTNTHYESFYPVQYPKMPIKKSFTGTPTKSETFS